MFAAAMMASLGIFIQTIGMEPIKIEGRAPPIRSNCRFFINETIKSGDVNRPTPTTGFEVIDLTRPTMGSKEKVAGRRMAIATAGPTPGIAPITTPPHDPMSSAIITSHIKVISSNQRGLKFVYCNLNGKYG